MDEDKVEKMHDDGARQHAVRVASAPISDEESPRPARRAGRSRVLVSGCLAVLTLLLVSSCVALYSLIVSPRFTAGRATLQVTQPVCGTWQALSGSILGPSIPRIIDFAVVAPDNVWGVGSGNSAYHWNGTRWREVELPGPSAAGNVYLHSIAALPGGEAWAVGSVSITARDTQGLVYNNEQGIVYHWDGNQWALATTFSPAGATTDLRSVAAISSSDVWAVGSYTTGQQSYSLSLHWDGTNWRQVDGPHDCTGDQYLAGAVTFASNHVWAVGGCSNDTLGHMTETVQSLVQRWDGKAWTAMPAPVGKPAQGIGTATAAVTTTDRTGAIGAIAATGPDDIWVEGYYMATDGIGHWAQPLLFHWDGAGWSEADLTQPGIGAIRSLSDLTAIAPDDVWAVGHFVGANLTPVALHWDGSAWGRVPIANPLVEGYYTSIGTLGPHTLLATGFGFDNEDGEYYGLIARFESQQCPGG